MVKLVLYLALNTHHSIFSAAIALNTRVSAMLE